MFRNLIHKQRLKFIGLVGIAHLFSVYESTPNYTNEEGTMNVADQLAAVSYHNYWLLSYHSFSGVHQIHIYLESA